MGCFLNKKKIAVLSAFLLILSACAGPQSREELIWPLPPDEPKIKFLKSFRGSRDIEKRTFLTPIKEFFFGRSPAVGLAKPYAVHVDKDGRILVADSAWRNIILFDEAEGTFKMIGIDGPGVLSMPRAITTDAEGRIYVTDATQARAVVYDRDGNFLYAIGERGQFEKPIGIAVNDGLKRVYIVDTKGHKVSVFDTREGRFLFDIGERGVEDGEFNWPTHITVDKSGKVFVVDTFNFRIQVFDADGRFINKWGSVGTGMGQFAKPKGISIDSEGHVYVVDAAFNNVQIFDEKGQLMLFFGGFGSSRGSFWLPAGIFIDHDDKIYVVDQYNHRLNIYQYLGGVYQAKQAKQAQAKLGSNEAGEVPEKGSAPEE